MGQVGLPSTNSGLREGNGGFSLNSLPTGDNPITAKFPNYLWPEAIKDGTKLTALNAGIQGADALPAPIKMMINYGNNMPANQNGDINFTTDILRDDSLCEFIVCYDVVMTDSAKYAATWELPEGDVIYPIPVYVPGFDGPDANTDEYPMQFTGYHTKAHTHSSYANNQIIQDAHRHNIWINPLDAAARNIETGDMVRVFNDHGEILIEAKVTDRIMPSVGAIPQGIWHDADMDGDRVDKGGCINTLTSRHCTLEIM